MLRHTVWAGASPQSQSPWTGWTGNVRCCDRCEQQGLDLGLTCDLLSFNPYASVSLTVQYCTRTRTRFGRAETYYYKIQNKWAGCGHTVVFASIGHSQPFDDRSRGVCLPLARTISPP